MDVHFIVLVLSFMYIPNISQGKCPSYIPNGYILNECSREPGSFCFSYVCKTECLKPTPTIELNMYDVYLHCDETGQWQNDRVCTCNDVSTTTIDITLARCSSSIPRGQILSSCDRLPGSDCGYSCDTGCFSKLNYLTCSAYSSWHNGETACNCPGTTKAYALCPSTIPNGRIAESCHRLPYSHCGFSCDTGCYSNRVTLTCGNTGAWYFGFRACRCDGKSTSTVSSIYCPLRIPNGVIQTLYGNRCDFKPYSECSFRCDSGCYSGALTTTLTCSKWGTWTGGDRACRCRDLQSTGTTTTAEQTRDEDSGYAYDRLALAIGSTVMSLITVVVVIAIKCFLRNRLCWKNRAPPSMTETTTNNDTAAGMSPYGFHNTEFEHTNPIIHTSGNQTAAFQQTSPAITSQYGISDTPSQPSGRFAHTSIQGPPAYHTIFSYDEDPRGPPPAYEEATAHPLTF